MLLLFEVFFTKKSMSIIFLLFLKNHFWYQHIKMIWKHKNILIQSKKKNQFFWKCFLNHGFTKHKTAFFLPQFQPQFFNQTQETAFFKTTTSTTVLTKHQLFLKSTSQKVLFIKLLFSIRNHKSYHNTKHTLYLCKNSNNLN